MAGGPYSLERVVILLNRLPLWAGCSMYCTSFDSWVTAPLKFEGIETESFELSDYELAQKAFAGKTASLRQFGFLGNG